MSRNTKIFELAAVALLVLGLVTVMTYPWMFKLTTHIPGFFSTDEPYGNLWESWRINYSLSNNIPLAYTPLVSYPFGLDISNAGYCGELWAAILFFLSLFNAHIFTYNLQIAVNFFLTGIITYLFVFQVTRSRLSAALSAIVFTFCPYNLARTWQHLGLTFNQWIPLVLLAAVLLKEKKSFRYSVLFLVSLLLLFSFDYTITYLGLVSLVFFIFYTLAYGWRKKLFSRQNALTPDLIFLGKIAVIGVIAFAVLSFQLAPVIMKAMKFSALEPAASYSPYRRPFDDLFFQSARPLSYLLPAAAHPLLGKFTGRFLGSSLYGNSLTEHTLYLGWLPLVLAFTALCRWKKNRRSSFRFEAESGAGHAGTGAGGTGDDFYIGFFIFLALGAWLFSQPPWWQIGPFKLYMPSFVIYRILPMFRAYCRFGIIVMLAVAALAGFTVKYILKKFGSAATKAAVTALFCGLIIFEFWNYPPLKVINVDEVPEAYYWLRQKPGDFVIAVYPLDLETPNEVYKYYQTRHEKKMINCTFPGTPANRVARSIDKLSAHGTAGVLSGMGVKYVLVHRDKYLDTELTADREELAKIPHNPWLKLIKVFAAQGCPEKGIACVQETGPIEVYEVTARPEKSGGQGDTAKGSQ